MLDQHVAVTIGQDVCNLPAPLRDAKTIAYRPWINIWWLFGGVLGGIKQNSPEDIASELRTFGGR